MAIATGMRQYAVKELDKDQFMDLARRSVEESRRVHDKFCNDPNLPEFLQAYKRHGLVSPEEITTALGDHEQFFERYDHMPVGSFYVPSRIRPSDLHLSRKWSGNFPVLSANLHQDELRGFSYNFIEKRTAISMADPTVFLATNDGPGPDLSYPQLGYKSIGYISPDLSYRVSEIEGMSEEEAAKTFGKLAESAFRKGSGLFIGIYDTDHICGIAGYRGPTHFHDAETLTKFAIDFLKAARKHADVNSDYAAPDRGRLLPA